MCCRQSDGCPGEQGRLHAFIDDVYFTILSSNCFGPPEGHLLVGCPIKLLHSVHSLVMITMAAVA